MTKIDKKIRNKILKTFTLQLDYATNGIVESEIDETVSQIKKVIREEIMKKMPKKESTPDFTGQTREWESLGINIGISRCKSVIKNILD